MVDGMNLLRKLIKNILEKPTEEKFRVLKKTNKTIASKLMSLQPDGSVLQLLAALGYVEVDSDNVAFVGNYFNILSSANFTIKDPIMPMILECMDPEEAKKEKMIWQNKKDMIEKQKKDQERKKEMERYSQMDRKVKGEEKNPDSVGNKLTYGANIKKFEPPAASKGG